MSERRSNTILAVVGRHDHHCGDDLIIAMPQLSVFVVHLTYRRNRIILSSTERFAAIIVSSFARLFSSFAIFYCRSTKQSNLEL